MWPDRVHGIAQLFVRETEQRPGDVALAKGFHAGATWVANQGRLARAVRFVGDPLAQPLSADHERTRARCPHNFADRPYAGADGIGTFGRQARDAAPLT